MHTEAFDWVSRFATVDPISVLEIGARYINGGVKCLFLNSDYTSLDILPGDGVDIVADAATWTPDREYDIVVCAEVFEHTKSWASICRTANRALRRGGVFIVTCAGPGRGAHSQIDGGQLRRKEHYRNVNPEDLQIALQCAGFIHIVVDQLGQDVRAHARKWGP